MKKPSTYEKAYAELAEILEKLQGGDAEIDELSALVKRAKELIKFCQDKLRDIEGEVKDLL